MLRERRIDAARRLLLLLGRGGVSSSLILERARVFFLAFGQREGEERGGGK